MLLEGWMIEMQYSFPHCNQSAFTNLTRYIMSLVRVNIICKVLYVAAMYAVTLLHLFEIDA